MEIRWQVDDGYCGQARPHHTTIPDDELMEDCETTEDRSKLIEQYIQEDFEQTITWSCPRLDENLAAWEANHPDRKGA